MLDLLVLLVVLVVEYILAVVGSSRGVGMTTSTRTVGGGFAGPGVLLVLLCKDLGQ